LCHVCAIVSLTTLILGCDIIIDISDGVVGGKNMEGDAGRATTP